MKYRFYSNSRSAWDGMLSGIDDANESIFLEMYVFDDDGIGNDFITRLAQKAMTGVRVVVVIDALGSAKNNESTFERLRSAGGEVLYFSHWFKRTHRKLLIIDESIVFIGGVNIADRFAPWKDLQVEIRSTRIAKSAVRSFARIYGECDGLNPILFSLKHRPRVFEKARSWFLAHNIGGRLTLRTYYEEHIDRAKHSITLVTPYFIPHRWLIAHLHNVIIRGVEVVIITPKHTDHRIADHVNEHYLGLFAQIGAHCFQLKEMNHAKAMLIDNTEAIVGTHNLDALSFDWNAESGVFFREPEMVHDLSRIIEEWKRGAKPFLSENVTRHWYDFALTSLLQIVHSVL